MKKPDEGSSQVLNTEVFFFFFFQGKMLFLFKDGRKRLLKISITSGVWQKFQVCGNDDLLRFLLFRGFQDTAK